MQVTTELLEMLREENAKGTFPMVSGRIVGALVEEIERLRADNARLREALTEAEKERDMYAKDAAAALGGMNKLSEGIDRLRESLKPFADVAVYIDVETFGYKDADQIVLCTKDAYDKIHGLFDDLSVGQFRRARAALEGK